MRKLNPEVKAKWVAALRSGEYKQGYRNLRSPDDRFCCLGVLCDLAAKEGVIPPATIMHGLFFYGESSALPSEAVSSWAFGKPFTYSSAFNTLDKKSGRNRHLAYFNDEVGMSFSQIADLIEEKL